MKIKSWLAGALALGAKLSCVEQADVEILHPNQAKRTNIKKGRRVE